MAQYSSDPQLKSKFLRFMAEQADTKYSVVDNQLTWVLWLYSLIWMPLLVLMCLTRMGKGAAAAGSEQGSEGVPTAGTAPQQQLKVAGLDHQQRQQQLHAAMASAAGGGAGGGGSGGYSPRGGAAPGGGLRLRTAQSAQYPSEYYSSSAFGNSSMFAAASGQQQQPIGAPTPRQRRGAAVGGGSLDLPPRYSVPGSFGRSGSFADGDGDGTSSTRSGAGSGRSLRHALNSGGSMGSSGMRGYSQQLRASSDRLHMSRPSKLQGSASLPPQALLGKRGSSASGGSGSLVGGGYGGGGADVRLVDQAALLGNGVMMGSSDGSGGSIGRGFPGKAAKHHNHHHHQQQLGARGSRTGDVGLVGHDDAAAAADDM